MGSTQVTAFLEDTIKSISPLPARPPLSPLQRLPSLRATARQPNEGFRSVQSLRSPQMAGATLSPALEADSWRSKAKALPPTPRQIHARPSVPAPPATPKPPPPMLHGVEPLTVQPDEDLEVVDFSDMGKFVGVADPPPTEEERGDDDRSSRPSRPVAADFFGENSSSVTSKSDTGPWRRKLSHDLDHDSLTSASAPPDQSDIVSPLEQPADTTSVRPHV